MIESELQQAIDGLADLLETENAALERGDLTGAAKGVGLKQRLITTLLRARETSCAIQTADAAGIAKRLARLDSLSQCNARLLKGAIAVQGELLHLVTQFAVKASAPASYATPRGQAARNTRPMALISRA